MSKHSGQALTEFLVSLLWIVPFALLFYVVAQMWNVQITANKAARYMAWERTAYSNADYDSRVSDLNFGFENDVVNRFLINGNVGFGGVNVGGSRVWLSHQTDNSIVDVTQGVEFESPGIDDQAKIRANSFLDQRTSRVSWMQDRGGVELNTAEGAYLTIPYSKADNYALKDLAVVDPEARASYMLIADSWAPGSEDIYADRVSEVRDRLVPAAHRLWMNSPVVRGVKGTFKELDQKLFIDSANPGNSFEMVSPNQSTSLPTNLGYYVD
jgi:hypothetical protein